MKVKPEGICRRFRRAYEVPDREATDDTKSILEDTVRLVEGQFPQMDVAPVYHRLSYTRAAQDANTQISKTSPRQSAEG